MSQIVLKSKWFSDNRRYNLILKTSPVIADGIWVNAIKIAREFWIPNKNLIPVSDWEKQNICDINLLVDCRLAEIREGGIYISGSEENFNWYFDTKEARSNAGKKSAEKRKILYGTAQPMAKNTQRSAEYTECGIVPNTPEQPRTAPNKPRTDSNKSNLILYYINNNILINNTNNTYNNKNNKKHNIAHFEQNEQALTIDELLSIVYEKYPKKIGKQRGIKTLKNKIKTSEQANDLIKAVSNYASYTENKDKEYIKHFSTFANEWEDWIDYNQNNQPKLTPKSMDDL